MTRTSPTDRTTEVRMRRTLARRGYSLHKSPRRDPAAIGYGLYQIVVANQSPVEDDYLLSLDEVEAAVATAVELVDYRPLLPALRACYNPKSWHLLLIDAENGVSIAERHEYEGTPAWEWCHGRLAIRMPDVLDPEIIHPGLTRGGELAVLIDRIREGHGVDYEDGSPRGTLTEDAQEAQGQLEALLAHNDEGDAYVSDLKIYPVREFLADGDGIEGNLRNYRLDASSTLEQITEAAAEMADCARSERYLVDQAALVRLICEAVSAPDDAGG